MAISVPVTPETDVILLKVPLEMDEKNTLTFANATDQYNYFHGLTGSRTFDKFTYQRKDGTITVPELIDNLYGYNYVMYRNENFSNKWFYAFIVEMKFLSPNSTSIKIKTDVWETWQWNITLKPCFVEREHVNDDTIGANTVPEGMDVGEYVLNGVPHAIHPSKIVKDENNNVLQNSMMICFQVTETVGTISVGNNINRTFSGLYIMCVKDATSARNLIKVFSNLGKSDAIVSIFMAPVEFFNGCHHVSDTFTSPAVTIDIYSPKDISVATPLLETTTISMNSTIDGYTPKNNKLFTYPYNYLYVTNNAGIDIQYRYEDFLSATPKFYMGGTLGQGCSVKLAPINYKHLGTSTTPVENYSYSITGAKYPVCAWKSDYYTNWLAQNATNIQANILNSTASGFVMGTAFSGGNVGMGVVMGGVNLAQSAISAYAQDAKAKIIPDQAHGNTNCSDVNFAWGKYYTALNMSVRYEYAQIIDDFFSMFGYKVNRVKVPNHIGRTNWNYVKTVDCYIRGDIPQEDILEIQAMFNNGVTFWHTTQYFGDYSRSNNRQV